MAALLLFGVTLYISASIFLLNPVMDMAKAHAMGHANQWHSPDDTDACSAFQPSGQFEQGPGQGPFNNELVACFDQNGILVQRPSVTQLPSAFLGGSLVQTALQTGQPQSDTVDAGGETGPIYRYALVVRTPDGKPAGVIVIGESIKDKEDALALLLRLLLAVGGGALLIAGLGGLFLANRALAPARLAWNNQQRFIADAAHELRTPLTLLRADAEVLLRGHKRMEAEDAMLLDDIVAETNHMSHLATSMLTLARLDSGVFHREHEVINLAALAQKQIQRFKALADQKGIVIEAQNSGAPYVIGDPILLEQATLALLDNAIKYNRQDGHIVLRTTEEPGQALLAVSDTGIGIDEEHLPHLGERFYRVDKARSREAGGSGLGLSITRSIVQAHGGQLSLVSSPGQGTTVTLSLPLAHTNHASVLDKGTETAVTQE